MPYSDLDIMWNDSSLFYYLSFLMLAFNYNSELLNLGLSLNHSLENGFNNYTTNNNITLWFFIIYIIIENLYGLFPFFFSFSSHFFISVNIALMSYFCCLYVNHLNNVNAFFYPEFNNNHFIWFLNFFNLAINSAIVAFSNLFISSIHVTTLSFRLGINMSAGHIIIGVYSNSLLFLFLFLFYEFFACFIQSFIFYLISNIYFS